MPALSPVQYEQKSLTGRHGAETKRRRRKVPKGELRTELARKEATSRPEPEQESPLGPKTLCAGTTDCSTTGTAGVSVYITVFLE